MNVMPWTDERIAELKDLWASGHSTGQIAKLWGVTRNMIMGKISRLRLESPSEKLTIVANGRPRKPNPHPRRPTEPRRHVIRRTNNAHQFVLETGELVEKPARGANTVFTAMSDIKPFMTTDGTEISSRSGLRDYERANGVRQIGNDWTGPERPAFWDRLKGKSK